MRFILVVTGPAYGTQQATSAYQFVQTLLSTNHTIISIFFYRDGVYNANLFTSPANDEIDLVRAWYNLHKKYDIALYVCVSAALRRGVINLTEAERTGISSENLQEGFILTGLSTLAIAALTCDRLVQF